MRPTSFLLIALVQGYRWLVSPILPPSCRYWPSCSEYAIDAIRIHGAVAGGWLAARRLARCHPWGGAGGLDPVPASLGACRGSAGRPSKHVSGTSAIGEPLV